MNLLTVTGRISVALAAACLAAAPLAHADRGGRVGYHDRYMHHGHYNHDEWPSEYRGKGDKHRGRHSDDRGYKRSHKRPIVIYAPSVYYGPPVYYAPSRRVVTYSHGYSYGPHYSRGYEPRWEIGHFYESAVPCMELALPRVIGRIACEAGRRAPPSVLSAALFWARLWAPSPTSYQRASFFRDRRASTCSIRAPETFPGLLRVVSSTLLCGAVL